MRDYMITKVMFHGTIVWTAVLLLGTVQIRSVKAGGHEMPCDALQEHTGVQIPNQDHLHNVNVYSRRYIYPLLTDFAPYTSALDSYDDCGFGRMIQSDIQSFVNDFTAALRLPAPEVRITAIRELVEKDLCLGVAIDQSSLDSKPVDITLAALDLAIQTIPLRASAYCME